MSDHAPDAADEVERVLARCTGRVDCPCCSHSLTLRLTEGFGSPSGKRTAPSGSVGGGQSEENGIADDASSSKHSETIVPDAWMERDWSKMCTVKLPRCECRRFAVLKRAASGSNTGRLFFGCPKEDAEGPCQFVDWVYAPWPQRLQKSLKDLCIVHRFRSIFQAAGVWFTSFTSSSDSRHADSPLSQAPKAQQIQPIKHVCIGYRAAA